MSATATALPPMLSPGVPIAPWPEIDREERELAEVVAQEVIAHRGGAPASVAHEEQLEADVYAVLARAIESPRQSRLPLSVVGTIAADPHYRALIARNAVILASHPLSTVPAGLRCRPREHRLPGSRPLGGEHRRPQAAAGRGLAVCQRR